MKDFSDLQEKIKDEDILYLTVIDINTTKTITYTANNITKKLLTTPSTGLIHQETLSNVLEYAFFDPFTAHKTITMFAIPSKLDDIVKNINDYCEERHKYDYENYPAGDYKQHFKFTITNPNNTDNKDLIGEIVQALLTINVNVAYFYNLQNEVVIAVKLKYTDNTKDLQDKNILHSKDYYFTILKLQYAIKQICNIYKVNYDEKSFKIIDLPL